MNKLRGNRSQYMSFCLAVFVIVSTFFISSLDALAYTKAVKGTSKNKTMAFSIVNNGMNENNWNTTLGGTYLYDFEIDNEIYVKDFEATDQYDNFVGYFNNLFSDYERRDRTYAYGYYLGGTKIMFDSAPDAYYYNVKIDLSNVVYNHEQVKWARFIIGSYTDMVNGTAEICGSVQNISSIEKVVMNDFRQEPIYIGVLVCYWNRLDSVVLQDQQQNTNQEWAFNASINMTCDLNITYTPYFLDEGAGDINAELSEQTDELKDINSELDNIYDESTTQSSLLQSVIRGNQNNTEHMLDAMGDQLSESQAQTDELEEQNENLEILQNGYSTTAANTMNNKFSKSLNNYSTSEDSLFTSATTGLDNFNFYSFSSVPNLVTAVSFVTATMTSIFGAMGGEAGPMGIVLSVMFSVILVSMAVGLYRFFTSSKKGGDS